MKSSFTRRSAIATATAVLALGGLSTACAQDIKERTLKFATQNPKGHPLVDGMEKFAEAVKVKSGGKISVKLFPGGVLGGDAQNVSALQGGTLEMVTLNSGILANVAREFAIYDFPFLFASAQEAEAVVDGSFGKMMHDKLDAKGIHGLGYFELGFRELTNSKRPITKVEDIEGLKLRVIPNAINVDWVKALGANPTPLAFPELYAALEQKAIDGQENPVTVILANKFYEVQKHLALTNHQYNPQSVIIASKTWDAMNAAEKKVIEEATAEAVKVQRASARKQAETAIAELKKNGMEISELAPAEMAKLREKMKPVTEKHMATVGADTVAALQAEIAKVRK